MTPYDDDAHVIARSIDEPDEFGIIFDRYHSDIYSYVAKRVGLDAAGDVTSDVFVTAFRKRHKYDTARPQARPWLYGIASNLIKTSLRKKGRRLLTERRSAGIAVPPPPETDEVLDREEAVWRANRVSEALDDLHPKYRETLLLVAWAGMTYADVATALDIPIGTVRSRVNKARKEIRELAGLGGEQ